MTPSGIKHAIFRLVAQCNFGHGINKFSYILYLSLCIFYITSVLIENPGKYISCLKPPFRITFVRVKYKGVNMHFLR